MRGSQHQATIISTWANGWVCGSWDISGLGAAWTTWWEIWRCIWTSKCIISSTSERRVFTIFTLHTSRADTLAPKWLFLEILVNNDIKSFQLLLTMKIWQGKWIKNLIIISTWANRRLCESWKFSGLGAAWSTWWKIWRRFWTSKFRRQAKIFTHL